MTTNVNETWSHNCFKAKSYFHCMEVFNFHIGKAPSFPGSVNEWSCSESAALKFKAPARMSLCKCGCYPASFGPIVFSSFSVHFLINSYQPFPTKEG